MVYDLNSLECGGQAATLITRLSLNSRASTSGSFSLRVQIFNSLEWARPTRFAVVDQFVVPVIRPGRVCVSSPRRLGLWEDSVPRGQQASKSDAKDARSRREGIHGLQ